MAAITKEFPNIRSHLTGDFLKLYTDTHEERRLAVQLLKKLQFQFYTLKAKADRPIKVVIKGLPRTSKPEEIKEDLEFLGYTPERDCSYSPEAKKATPILRKLAKKPVIIPPLAGRNGILYSDDEKAEEFKNNLEATFQENPEPYNDAIIKLVESETYDFLANSEYASTTAHQSSRNL
ncbi:hypothetical protein TNCV_1249811 [Trichonephila clavipes]|nr:hypothetical protein TNCV_1249811 [Trichonephila clavipes]